MSGNIMIESSVAEIAKAMTEGQRQHMANHLLKHYEIKPQRVESVEYDKAYADGRKAGHEEARADCYLEALTEGMNAGYSVALSDMHSELKLLEKRL